MAVGYLSNGCRASSISDILASAAQKMIPPLDWGALFQRRACGPTKLTRPLKKEVEAYARLCQLIIVNTRF